MGISGVDLFLYCETDIDIIIDQASDPLDPVLGFTLGGVTSSTFCVTSFLLYILCCNVSVVSFMLYPASCLAWPLFAGSILDAPHGAKAGACDGGPIFT